MQTPHPKSTPTSIRLPAALSKNIDAMAAQLDRSRSWVIEEAVSTYLDIHKEHVAAIEEGIRQADAGMGVSHEQAVKNFQAFRKTQRLKPLRGKSVPTHTSRTKH
jgi:predicted transcriptional regulator